MQIRSFIDLTVNEIRNAIFHILASDPSSPVEGQFWYNSTAKKFRGRTDSATVDLNGSTGGGGTVTSVSIGAPAAGITQSGSPITGSGTITLALADDLAAIEALGSTGLAARTAASSWTTRTITGTTNHITVTNGDGVSGNPTITTSGTSANTASALVQRDGTGNFAAGQITATKVTGLNAPTAGTDAANKDYVDGIATGLDVKASVRAVSVANITLSGTQTIDGVSLVAGDRILVAGQTTASNNGIYVVAAGGWARSTDADSSAEVTSGMFTFVTEGTTYGDTGWVLSTNDAITLGTTSLAFTQFSGAQTFSAGTGLTKTGTTFAIDTANGYGVRKYAASIGDGSSVAIVVTHNLGTQDVIVGFNQVASPYAMVLTDWEATSTNTITVRFSTAPTSNQYRVIVTG